MSSKLKGLLCLAVFFCALCAVHGQPSGTSSVKPVVLTVCQALEKRIQLDGSIVSIRGHVTGTMEGAWLDSFTCPGIVKSGDFVWPSMISLENPFTAKKIHPIDFIEDSASRKRVEEKYLQLRKRVPDNCIEFIYTGQFGTRPEFENIVYPDGTMLHLGFGHGSGSPAQLVIRSSDDVVAVQGCK